MEKLPCWAQGPIQRSQTNMAGMQVEAIASHDLRIWTLFSSIGGASNEAIVFHHSPALNPLRAGKQPIVPYVSDKYQVLYSYIIGDGIYPRVAIMAKSPTTVMAHDICRMYLANVLESARKMVERAFICRMYLANVLESARKMVERAFGVLKTCFKSLEVPSHLFEKEDVVAQVHTMIILHNMRRDDINKRFADNEEGLLVLIEKEIRYSWKASNDEVYLDQLSMLPIGEVSSEVKRINVHHGFMQYTEGCNQNQVIANNSIQIEDKQSQKHLMDGILAYVSKSHKERIERFVARRKADHVFFVKTNRCVGIYTAGKFKKAAKSSLDEEQSSEEKRSKRRCIK